MTENGFGGILFDCLEFVKCHAALRFRAIEPRAAQIRDHAARSWPPAEQAGAPGWLLRSTPAVDRGRLNSALPLDADPDVAPVESFYLARGRPPQVQLTPLEAHPRLTAELDARGWGTKWPTAVLAADAARAAGGTGATAIEVLRSPTPRWLAAWGACEQRDAADVDAHAREVLAQLGGRAGYAIDAHGDAVGIGVSDDGLCGLFCIAVAPERRRAGLGTAIVRALAAWALDRGAATLYLEVEERNAAALALYAQLGFERCYRYVHRIAA